MQIIDVFVENPARLPFQGINKKFIKQLASAIMELKQLDNAGLCVILTDNEYIRGINNRYRGKDSATDVISFAYREEPFPSDGSLTEQLGDIYISLEKVHEQALLYNVSVKDEFRRLLVHGILHLLGYDHEGSSGKRRLMEEEEESILSSLQ